MEIKFFIYTALLIIVYIINVRGLKSVEDEAVRVKLRNQWLYSIIAIFGWSFIIDTSMDLQKRIGILWTVVIILFFVIFFGLVVYWQYRRTVK